MRIIPYEDRYRDDLIFMILEAKDALGRIPRLNEDLLDISGHYFAQGGAFFLAVSQADRVIGSLGCNPVPGTSEAWLHRFYVKAALKRQGIGTLLYTHVETLLRNQGASCVRVHLGGRGYEASHEFYKSFGFQYDSDTEYMRKWLRSQAVAERGRPADDPAGPKAAAAKPAKIQ